MRGTTGVSIAYDLAGQRRQAVNGSDNSTEDYSYSADGYLEDVKINGVLRARRNADLAGRVTQYTEWNAGGAQSYTRASTYDADNRVLRENGSPRRAQ